MDKESRIAECALRAVASTGTIEDDALYDLVIEYVLDMNKHFALRHMAIIAASNGHGTRANIVDVLIKAYPTLPMNDGPATFDVRATCLRCLSGVGGEDRRAIQFLIDCLADPKESTASRLEAARGLVTRGRAAASAMPLFKQLSESDINPDFADNVKTLFREFEAKVRSTKLTNKDQ